MPKPVVAPLGKLETDVMDVVWSDGEVTAREVHGRLRGRARAYTTIMTTLDRLYRKGLLRRRKDGLAWRYAAQLGRDEFERRLAETLASRILSAHGDAALAGIVDAAENVRPALLDELSKLIAARRRGAK
jgi:predicted transcriptional regulator